MPDPQVKWRSSQKQQKTQTVVCVKLEKDGDVNLKAEEVLAKLEQHGAECNMRYERIEEQLQEQKKTLDKLDVRLWGLAVLIVAAAVAEQLV